MNVIAQLTSQTPVVFSIGGMAAIAGSLLTFLALLIGVIWRASAKLGGIERSIGGLTDAIKQCWTKHDQERWTHRLYRDNRSINLSVPDVNSDTQHGN